METTESPCSNVETVDLVITDINMPKMNGYEVDGRQSAGNPAYNASLLILVLTTESDTDKKNIAREAGATGWMVKPFDPERLVATDPQGHPRSARGSGREFSQCRASNN